MGTSRESLEALKFRVSVTITRPAESRARVSVFFLVVSARVKEVRKARLSDSVLSGLRLPFVVSAGNFFFVLDSVSDVISAATLFLFLT
jgi:hypothetical protein